MYKKKKNAFGGDKVLKKDGTFNPPKTESARFEKLSKRIDVWYEGVLVLGTNHVKVEPNEEYGSTQINTEGICPVYLSVLQKCTEDR